MTDPARLPVVVGVGQLRANRERRPDQAREPIELLLDAVRAAAADATPDTGSEVAARLLASVDDVSTVRTVSWSYDEPGALVARRIGARPRTVVDAPIGGQWPTRLLDGAAARIAAGDSTVALVVGAEAQASVTAFGRAGVDPVAELGWSADPGGPPRFDPDELGTPRMHAAGLVLPARVYPLFENRLAAELGMRPSEALAWSAELYAAFSRIAADQPAAWAGEPSSAEEIATVGPRNRMVCEPYPLAMNALPHVDQAAAVLVTSLAAARELGLDPSRLVHVRGGAGCDDTLDLLDRESFARSTAMADVLDRALDAAGAAAEDLDLLDVYSCFPVVPKLAITHLGLPRSAVPTVTGGHSSFGGPLNSYSLHALATMVERLREPSSGRRTPRLGLVHANGGYLTYQHAVLLGTEASPDGYVGDPEPRVLPAAGPPAADGRTLVADGARDLVVETATVEHGRDGIPAQAFVVGRTADGIRTAATTAPGDRSAAAALSLAALPEGTTSQVGRVVRLVPAGDGCAVVV